MTARTAPESHKNDGLSVFKLKGSILRWINDNVSFTVFFKNINIHCTFRSHVVYLP